MIDCRITVVLVTTEHFPWSHHENTVVPVIKEEAESNRIRNLFRESLKGGPQVV